MNDELEARYSAIDQRLLATAAAYTAQQLDLIGFSYVTVSPGDSTRYEFVFVRPPTIGQWDRFRRASWSSRPEACVFNNDHRYFVANQFGPLYGWAGGYVHPTYAWDKYVDQSRSSAPWTAMIVAGFMTAVGEAITERAKEQSES